MLHYVVWQKFTEVSEGFIATIIRAMMEAVTTSETLVNFCQTIQCNTPEDSHLLVLNMLEITDLCLGSETGYYD
jgi:hypothetical protein